MTPEDLNNALQSAALTHVQEIKTGNYSIRGHKRVSRDPSDETSSKPTSGQRRRSPRENVTSGWLVIQAQSPSSSRVGVKTCVHPPVSS